MAQSAKKVLIDKANATVVVTVCIATFVTIFSLIAAKSLLSQSSYQSRVVSARETARDQLKANITAADNLSQSYQTFESSVQNVIGGSSTGNGEHDGDNARIVLDALPSKYDFPALTTSLEKLAKGQSLTLTGISGIDDESKQQGAATSDAPKAVEIPFTVSASGGYDSIQNLILVFEHSIRPFSINKLDFKAGASGGLTVSVDAKTYYQPERGFDSKSVVIQ